MPEAIDFFQLDFFSINFPIIKIIFKACLKLPGSTIKKPLTKCFAILHSLITADAFSVYKRNIFRRLSITYWMRIDKIQKNNIQHWNFAINNSIEILFLKMSLFQDPLRLAPIFENGNQLKGVLFCFLVCLVLLVDFNFFKPTKRLDEMISNHSLKYGHWTGCSLILALLHQTSILKRHL